MGETRHEAAGIRRALRELASEERARSSARYFKTGQGEYGAGDRFLGVTVPDQRAVARRFRDLPLDEVVSLLSSPWHEERLCALFILVGLFERARTDRERQRVVDTYLAHLDRVNNWDLVDSSAPKILGAWLRGRDRGLLDELVASPSLWERRVAMLATLELIRGGESADALRLAERLLDDPEDLLHKAAGWMLREVGQRVSIDDLRRFLERHAGRMPRTMLRYAIEKLEPEERRRWMSVRRGARRPRSA